MSSSYYTNLPSYFSVFWRVVACPQLTTFFSISSLFFQWLREKLAAAAFLSSCISFQLLSSLLPIPSFHNPSSSCSPTGRNYNQWRQLLPNPVTLTLLAPSFHTINKGVRVGETNLPEAQLHLWLRVMSTLQLWSELYIATHLGCLQMGQMHNGPTATNCRCPLGGGIEYYYKCPYLCPCTCHYVPPGYPPQ